MDTLARSPRYGRVRQRITWFMWAPLLLYLGTTWPLLVGGVGGPIGRGIGAVLLVVFLVWAGDRLVWTPAVETDAEGIRVRPEMGRGSVFVEWDDVEEVVIWYRHTGTRITMIGVRCRPGFTYDNYGRFPVTEPNEGGWWDYSDPPRHVGRELQRWSVATGPTKARPVAALVNAAQKGITVTEVLERFPERVRNWTARPSSPSSR